MRKRWVATTLLLAASLATNAVLALGWLKRDPAPPPTAARLAQPNPGETPGPPLSLQSRRPIAEEPMAAKSLWPGSFTGVGTRETSPVDADAGSASLAARVATPELQQELLSQIAREHLRREWAKKKDQVVQSVRSDLRNPEKQRQDFEEELQRFGRVLGRHELEALRSRYGPIRERRLGQVERALTVEPPDFATVLSELRGLFDDEDRMVATLEGSEAQARFRLSQLEQRTVILGIAATYAEVPWDQAIWWP